MAFESVSEKFQNIFRNLRNGGRITEADVKTAMREVKMALLEADVNFRVVKSFVKKVEERAVGEDVLTGLNPGQTVIKIVHEELVNLLGPDPAELTLKPGLSVLMLTGLQGAGKTTMAAKLASRFKKNGRTPLLAALDVYRPAAIDQLKINGEKVGVPVFSVEGSKSPVEIAKKAYEYAKENHFNVLILDTAGRLHVDETMMEELVAIKEAIPVDDTILTVDAMTGQDAVNVAVSFEEKIGITGVILTKLDGDTRGGAALSIREITGKPILFSGIGEKLTDLEVFYPDRMASRLLGMGDVLTLIEKVQAEVEIEDAKALEKRMRKGQFDYNDYLSQLATMKKMGGISSILGMLPGMGLANRNALKNVNVDESEEKLRRVEVMISSMTPYERSHPDAMNLSRKARISRGSGIPMDEIHRMVKQFEESRKMMKQMTGMMGKKGHRNMRFPF
ncbi:MAG: signal recognition particle protein [Lachnospiraceae bacterium]|nr:signal recognition particle protein [Lachnospiraceae bacterium]